MKVYILKKDSSHLLDISFDVSLIPFQGSEDMKDQLLTVKKVDRPGPIQMVANFSALSELDFPIVNSSIEVMSKKMTDVLESVGEIKWNLLPAILLDDTFLENPLDKNGNPLPEVKVLNGFYVVQLLERPKVFDFDRSDYKVLESNPDYPGIIKKMVLRQPEGGFPPIFRMVEKRSLIFVSQPAKEALEKNNIKGCLFQEVEVSN
jgi:hypothetical protein